MAKQKWTKQTLKLQDNHGWRCKPGYKIFVANRGAVRFDIPGDWVIVPDPGGPVKFYDRQPPDDNYCLHLTVFELSQRHDWSGLSIREMFEEAIPRRPPDMTSRDEIVHIKRPDLELVWNEYRYIERIEKREACQRNALAFGSHIVPFLTLDFWPEDRPRVDPAWKEVLRSLQLGQSVKDPTRRVFH